MAEELTEQVDQVIDDPGGVAFDDDFVPPQDADVAARGPVNDTAATLTGRGVAYPTATPAGMQELRRYVVRRFGGTDLGTLSRPPREVRGGGQASLHNWGIAWDWRWAGPGPGRAAAESVIEWATGEHQALGVQAVHDYVECRYWKRGAGWRKAKASVETGFGQPWSQWLHIERSWDPANDPTPIDELLAGNEPSAPTVHHAASGDNEDRPLPRGPMSQPAGSVGAAVARLQDFLRVTGYATFTRSDGVFGPRTDAAVRAAQTDLAARGLYLKRIDGEWGPKSCEAGEALLRNR